MDETPEIDEGMEEATREAAEAALRMQEIEVGEWVLPLHKLQAGASVAYALVGLQPTNDLLAYGAALGVLWENVGGQRVTRADGERVLVPRPPFRARYRDMGRKWAEYGTRVVDELCAKGVPIGEVYVAGMMVWVRIFRESELWPSEREVQAARGNS